MRLARSCRQISTHRQSLSIMPVILPLWQGVHAPNYRALTIIPRTPLVGGLKHREEEMTDGLRKGLASYGDAGFSLFLRKAFIKAMGYSDDALERPIVG